VTVELDFADKRGTFFGTLWHNQGKQDFAEELLLEGLAEVNIIGTKTPANIDKLEDAEDSAKQNQVGIWGKGMKLASHSSPSKVKKFERIQVEMTDITDATRFFIKIVGEN
jgi:endonuclease YncB( thermonuclease family)